MNARAAAWVAGVLLVGLVIGVGVAIASSPTSLTPDHHQSSGVVLPSPSPVPSPSPTVLTHGILGSSPRLITNGSNTVIALGSGVAIVSQDGGRTWASVRQASPTAGIAIDPSNPRHAVSGGPAVQVTGDAGGTWSPVLKPPPGKGPYQAVAISPVEPNFWLFVHQGALLITRDGAATWSEVGGLPALNNPVVAFGQALGQVFVAVGGRIFQLSSYGQKVTEEPALTQGSPAVLAVAGGNQLTLIAQSPGHGDFAFDGTAWSAAGGGLTGPVAAGASATLLVGNGGNKLGSPGAVAYVTNGGAVWAQATGLPQDQTVEALAGQPSSSSFFAYCSGGDVYASTDGGRSWALVSRALRSAG